MGKCLLPGALVHVLSRVSLLPNAWDYPEHLPKLPFQGRAQLSILPIHTWKITALSLAKFLLRRSYCMIWLAVQRISRSLKNQLIADLESARTTSIPKKLVVPSYETFIGIVVLETTNQFKVMFLLVDRETQLASHPPRADSSLNLLASSFQCVANVWHKCSRTECSARVPDALKGPAQQSACPT